MANRVTQRVTERREGEDGSSEENLPLPSLMEVAAPPLTDSKKTEEAASLPLPPISEKDFPSMPKTTTTTAVVFQGRSRRNSSGTTDSCETTISSTIISAASIVENGKKKSVCLSETSGDVTSNATTAKENRLMIAIGPTEGPKAKNEARKAEVADTDRALSNQSSSSSKCNKKGTTAGAVTTAATAPGQKCLLRVWQRASLEPQWSACPWKI